MTASIMPMKNNIKKPVWRIFAVIFWIAVWYLLAAAVNQNLFLKIPTPTDTVIAFFGNLASSEFWAAVGSSLLHITLGFICACALGLVFGMLSGSFSVFETLSAPIVHLIRSVPVAAFIILAWLWVPNGILPSVIAFLMVLPIIWSATEQATRQTDKKLLEMAKIMGLSRIKTMFHVKLFGILPAFRAAVISGLGYAWKSGVAAEVICNPTGSIGSLLSGAKQDIDYPQVFAVTLAIVLLSLMIENVIKLVWREKKYD